MLDDQLSGGPGGAWWWRMFGAGGEEAEAPEGFAGRRFPAQAEAETWIGEFWAELADAGIDSVSLMEADREVYGPMSLHA